MAAVEVSADPADLAADAPTVAVNTVPADLVVTVMETAKAAWAETVTLAIIIDPAVRAIVREVLAAVKDPTDRITVTLLRIRRLHNRRLKSKFGVIASLNEAISF